MATDGGWEAIPDDEGWEPIPQSKKMGLLEATGVLPRAGTVPEGTTVSDHDPVEVAQQRFGALSVCPAR